MPRMTRGSTYPTRNGVAIRWPEDGERRHQDGFANDREARIWFDGNVAPRLRRGLPSAEITFEAFCLEYLARWEPPAQRTKDTLKEWLAPARAKFGTWRLRELEGAARDVAKWRVPFTEHQRYKYTRAVRQVLSAAIDWGYIDRNPAVLCGPNPQPRTEEVWPLTVDEVDAIAEELAPRDAAIVVFAAETGLRTNEWTATERRDIDRRDPAVAVVRRFAEGVLTPYPKTGRRRVPLTPRGEEALELLSPRLDTPVLFPGDKGGHLSLNNWRNRIWYPALEAAGVSQRGPYQLRHTFASEALANDVSVLQLAKLMGTSSAMIDRHYGHLTRDSEDMLRARLSRRRSASSKPANEGAE